MTILLACVLLAQDPAALVERLRSESVAERDAAAKHLLELGAAARPALEGAAKDSDAEVASRARSILLLLDLHEKVAPRIAKVVPGAAERLARGDDEAWCGLLFELFASEHSVALRPPVEPRDLDFLIPRALKGADESQRDRLAWVADHYRLVSAVPGLLDGLTDPRQAAFAVLKGLRSPEVVPELLRRVAAADGDSAGTAADLLGAMGAVEALPALVRTLESPLGYSRVYAARALGGLGAKEAAAPLARLLADPESGVVLTAAEALASLRATEAVPELRRHLARPDAKERESIALALGVIGAKEAGEDLVRLLGEGNPAPLREAAAVALSRLGRREAVPTLGRLLGEETTGDTEEVFEALVRLDAREALPDFLRAMRDEDAALRRRAVRALRALKHKEAVPALVVKFGDFDLEVRHEAVRAVTELAGKEAGPQAAAVLVDPKREKFERAAAATYLGQSGYVEGRTALLAVLADATGACEVRRAAAHALADLGVAEAVPEFRKLLKDKESVLRETAVLSLGRTASRGAVPELLERLKDEKEDDAVREAAARALGRVGGPEAVKPLLACLEDGSRATEAAEALGRLGDPSVLTALFKLFEHPTDPVTREVVDAAARLDRTRTVTWLRGLVERGNDESRVRAAQGLCRLGEREGARVLLEYALASPEIHLVSLNALRRPDLWKELGERTCRWDMESEAMEVGARLEILTGLRVDTSEREGTTFVLSEGVAQGWGSVLDVLEENSTSFVLEPGKVRLLTRDEELRFWQDWSRGRP